MQQAIAKREESWEERLDQIGSHPIGQRARQVGAESRGGQTLGRFAELLANSGILPPGADEPTNLFGQNRLRWHGSQQCAGQADDGFLDQNVGFERTQDIEILLGECVGTFQYERHVKHLR